MLSTQPLASRRIPLGIAAHSPLASRRKSKTDALVSIDSGIFWLSTVPNDPNGTNLCADTMQDTWS